ncbi:MAG TPA: hypothetical protein VFF27_05025, partial [Bacteroidia bacterium]|nr:hypothetical protein [Bacteroidia bacterium]
IVATILYGAQGLGIAFVVNIIVLPMIIKAIKYRAPLNFPEFFNSILHIAKTKSFLITTFTIFNIFIILKIGLQTLISPWILVVAFSAAIGMLFLFNRKQKKFSVYFKTFCIAPLLINMLLLLNFMGSSDPVQETYMFRNDLQPGRRGSYQKSTFIYLDEDAYSEFPGIRMFMDIDQMTNMTNIRYTFKNGLLGFRVMSDYEFIY